MIDFDFGVVLERWPLFVDGAWLTVRLALVATLSGFAIGTLCASAGRRPQPPLAGACLRRLCRADPQHAAAGADLPRLLRTVEPRPVAVGLHRRGDRAGDQCRRLRDRDHARRLRLGQPQPDRSRRMPRRCRGCRSTGTSCCCRRWSGSIPALTSQFVLLMLASSICSQISAEELTAIANHVQSDTFRPFETFILVGAALHPAVAADAARFLGRWARCCSRAAAGWALRCDDGHRIQRQPPAVPAAGRRVDRWSSRSSPLSAAACAASSSRWRASRRIGRLRGCDAACRCSWCRARRCWSSCSSPTSACRRWASRCPRWPRPASR